MSTAGGVKLAQAIARRIVLALTASGICRHWILRIEEIRFPQS
jgi:hypothetical protein